MAILRTDSTEDAHHATGHQHYPTTPRQASPSTGSSTPDSNTSDDVLKRNVPRCTHSTIAGKDIFPQPGTFDKVKVTKQNLRAHQQYLSQGDPGHSTAAGDASWARDSRQGPAGRTLGDRHPQNLNYEFQAPYVGLNPMQRFELEHAPITNSERWTLLIATIERQDMPKPDGNY